MSVNQPPYAVTINAIVGHSIAGIAVPSSRGELSEFAPRVIKIKINPDKIRDVIGKGGSVIQALTRETGTTIDIEDDGTISIACLSVEAGEDVFIVLDSITRLARASNNAIMGGGSGRTMSGGIDALEDDEHGPPGLRP